MPCRRVGILLEMLLEAHAQALRDSQCLVALPQKHQDLSCYWGGDPYRAGAKTQAVHKSDNVGAWYVDQCGELVYPLIQLQ
eukprot:13745576-Ditylum_brightwellii.AAC.1